MEEEVPIQVCTSIDVNRDVIIANRGRYVLVRTRSRMMTTLFYVRTFTTQTKKPGAEVVGRLPPPEEEEEDRGGRELQDEDREGLSLSRRKTFVKLLRILLDKVE